MSRPSTLALAGCLSAALAPAAEAAARPVDNIEHIVVFMQENRPYDHYFGSLQGVRGFNDRTALPLQNGLNSFYQPVNDTDASQYMLPFRCVAGYVAQWWAISVGLIYVFLSFYS